MNKKIVAAVSLLVILTFIGYIVFDTARNGSDANEEAVPVAKDNPPDQWMVANTLFVKEGLRAVAVGHEGTVYAGGDSFIKCFSSEMEELWNLAIPGKITALAAGDSILFAASEDIIYLVSMNGKISGEWGPYEAGSFFTSITSNKDYVAAADAVNKIVFIIKKDGEVASMVGHFGEKLIIPSPYFDVCLTPDNTLYMAHTGSFRIEKRSIDGILTDTYGKSGQGPEDFCGCCNPAHFTIIPQGFLTAEKGINRIKILNPDGGFIEYVSSVNDFIASVPLDIASADGITIYGANPADSKLYVFVKK
ncbi:MAG: hypothetical protein MUE74_08075 [Bacteroidales bacterium]|jgi:hypothetical protein|nr:hypothetical protein [Bacteroidales bacterium]